MKHSLKLQALSPKPATIYLDGSREANKVPPTQSDSSKCLIDSDTTSVLDSLWQQLAHQSKSDQETVIALSDSRKRHRNGTLKQPLLLSELGASRYQVSRHRHLVTALRAALCNVKTGGTTTLRDIYYRDVSAFGGKQSNLNLALHLLSRSLSLSLAVDLRILPSPKGLVWGGPLLELDLGTGAAPLSLEYRNCYTLIPYVSENTRLSADICPDVIVVLEKEAVLKSFCDYTRALNPTLKTIVLTGRGFPDTCTKRFLYVLHRAFPSAPVLVFVDSDVYGLRIFWNYVDQIDALLAGVFLLEYEQGQLTISAKERRLLVRLLLLNERLRNVKNHAESDSEVVKEEFKMEPTDEFSELPKTLRKLPTIQDSVKQEYPDSEDALENPLKNETQTKNQPNQNASSDTADPPFSSLQPVKTTHKLHNARTVHREITRALLLGAKSEMNVLADCPKNPHTLNQYLWSRISTAGTRLC